MIKLNLFNDFDEENEQAKSKIKNIKLSVFDTVTNGGKYFYNSTRPSSDLKSGFSRASTKAKEPNANRRRKDRMNFTEFYRHQYGYSPKPHEDLHCLNKFTTPKEVIQKRKIERKNKEELTKFDFPISLLSPNPFGVHYFELFGLSIGMYTKLKEEFRTIEFINKYLSQVPIYD